MLALAGIVPVDEGERAALVVAYAACRSMVELLYAAPVGDRAPLARPDVG